MPDSKGLVKSNPAVDSLGKHNRSFSTFDKSLSYRFAQTLRFGEYTPSFVFDSVPKDEISLNSHDAIDSLSLNAPFKGEIRKIKESFSVPDMAILPLNWDKIYAQPTNGDDVPADANCILWNFPYRFRQLWTSCFDGLSTFFENNLEGSPSDSGYNGFLTYALRLLILGEYVYSNGSLLKYCGYSGSAQFRFWRFGSHDVLSYDTWFDLAINALFGNIYEFALSVPEGSSSRTMWFNGLKVDSMAMPSRTHSSLRHALEIMRENPLCSVSAVDYDRADYTDYEANFLSPEFASGGIFSHGGLDFVTLYVIPSVDAGSYEFDEDYTNPVDSVLNLKRILAYQLVCAHYYSNSGIDFVYSADLYRQYVNNLLYHSQSENPWFDWNGMKLNYDVLSGACLMKGLGLTGESRLAESLSFAYNPDVSDSGLSVLPVWAAIFAFRKSLRFGDYFVGARTRALAPVNTDISVNNNMVSVVDVTRSIQAQRFANSVMRSRSKIEEYVESLFGRRPAPDFHNPFFLAREEEYIFGDDVQNTADVQVSDPQSRTANFRTRGSKYTFTFRNDDAHPCTYLQIISFDVRRFYTRSVDRQMLQVDRYDMFNPDFQYIGDQPIFGIELGYPHVLEDGNSKFSRVFGYTGRDMEYKASFDKCAGGFVENLPGFILTDSDRSHDEIAHIDSDFIRSYNTELDQFYLSLTGYSLGSYFHFMNVCTNLVNAKRPMAVDPQILA